MTPKNIVHLFWNWFVQGKMFFLTYYNGLLFIGIWHKRYKGFKLQEAFNLLQLATNIYGWGWWYICGHLSILYIRHVSLHFPKQKQKGNLH